QNSRQLSEKKDNIIALFLLSISRTEGAFVDLTSVSEAVWKYSSYIKLINEKMQEASADIIKEIFKNDLLEVLDLIIGKDNNLNDSQNIVINEITGHLGDSFNALIDMHKTDTDFSAKKLEQAQIEYIEKKDLIKFMRMADGTSACIGSDKNNYNKTMPQSLLDDMSFSFVIKRSRDNKIIGFLLGKYGVDNAGKAVVITHAVYLKEGYGDFQSVLNVMKYVEEFFSKMGIDSIDMTLRSYGGDAKPVIGKDGWEKKNSERLMGLLSANVSQIYGDPEVYNGNENQFVDMTVMKKKLSIDFEHIARSCA
ncbi:hypothetical protein KKC59_03490, partial [bacterium]|nr:hypothetical protein [bacterium]